MPLKYAGLPPGDRASGDIGILFPIIPCKKTNMESYFQIYTCL
jgi:hypothetical protein